MPSQKLKSENYTNLGGINTKSSPHQTGPFEFLDIVNYDFTTPGSLTPVPGTTQAVGTTLTGRIATLYEFERLSGFSQLILTANTNAYALVAGGAPTPFKTGLQNGSQFDFVTFVDRLFGANGDTFFRWDGTNVSKYSLPPGLTGSWGATAAIGGSLTPGVTGVFVCGYGYINDRGYMGPSSNGVTVVVNGITFNSITYYGMSQPADYGVSSIALFRSTPGGVDLYRTRSIDPAGASFVDTGFPLTDELAKDYLWFTLVPRYMDIVNNQLIMGGFSGALSSFAWSDIGEPEGVRADWNAEFRSDDGDRIKGVKAYAGDALILKERAFGKARFNNPEDVAFQEISDQYGMVSDRAFAVYDSIALWLDRQGIVRFNGAEPKLISTDIDPIFRRMNLDAARDTACAMRWDDRKEIWFAIPVDGATMNNLVVVYDYNVGKFYTRRGLEVSHLAMIKGGTSVPRGFYGDYRGTVHNFGASLVGDNGRGMTCLFRTRFIHDAGDTNEVLWRQFFLNCKSIPGVTTAFNVRMFPNYGDTSELETTMYSNPFQTRIDFGISSKSISAEVSQFATTHAVRVEGFAFSYRYLRGV